MAVTRTYEAFDVLGYKDWNNVPRVRVEINNGYEASEVSFTIDEVEQILEQLQEAAKTAVHAPNRTDEGDPWLDLFQRYKKYNAEEQAIQDQDAP